MISEQSELSISLTRRNRCSFIRIRSEPTEIYYVWQNVSAGQSSNSGSQTTKVEHLTTYASPGSTYKSISIPLPSSARAGQSWRLGLFPTGQGPGWQDLDNVLDEDNTRVLGVWSGPMEIKASMEERQFKRAKLDAKEVQKGNGKGKGKEKEKEKDEGPKQTRIQREWILQRDGTSTEEIPDLLRIIEQTSFDLDKVCHYHQESYLD
jgi:hypothetical protein